jgi:hypothetical protein
MAARQDAHAENPIASRIRLLANEVLGVYAVQLHEPKT